MESVDLIVIQVTTTGQEDKEKGLVQTNIRLLTHPRIIEMLEENGELAEKVKEHLEVITKKLFLTLRDI